MQGTTATYACDLHDALAKTRNHVADEYHELNRYVVPSIDLSQIQSGNGLHTSAPSPYLDDIYDGTALEVRETLENGLMAYLTPIGAQWVALAGAEGERLPSDALAWLHYASQALISLFNPSRSNFYAAIAESYTQDAAFGTSCIVPRLANSGRRLVFESLYSLTYCLGVDEDAVASTLTRDYRPTAEQLYKMFPETCPPAVVTEASKPDSRQNRHQVIYIAETNPEADPTVQRKGTAPFRALWVHKESQTLLKSEDLFEQPHAVATWQPRPLSPYGISPFVKVLPDIRSLQNTALNRSILVERAGNPPWYIPPGFDGKFDPRPHGVNIGAGRGTVDEQMPREIPVTGRLDYLQAEAREGQDAVKTAGYYDLFRLLSTSLDTQKTAYEVQQLMGERASLFHHFYSNKTQQLTQLLRRTLALALRSKLILPPPPSLMEQQEDGTWGMRDPELAYNSRLARAMELSAVSGLMQTIEMTLPFAGELGLNSPAFDWLNPEKATLAIARANGVSHDIMSTPEEIAAKQQARADAAAQQQAAIAAQTATESVRNLGGVDQAAKAATLLQ